MPAVRNTKPALAWRYPTRTPAPVRITSPLTPGRATAASAASETASGSGSSRACRKNDRTPIGMAPLGAGGAIPGSDDAGPTWLIAPKVDGATPKSVAIPVALPATGTPGTPASGRTSGNCDATDAPAAADRPAPPPNPATTGSAPAMPNKKEDRSDCSCVSGTTAPAPEVSMSCINAMTSEASATPSGTGAPPSVAGATPSVAGATPSVTGATALLTGATA